MPDSLRPFLRLGDVLARRVAERNTFGTLFMWQISDASGNIRTETVEPFVDDQRFIELESVLPFENAGEVSELWAPVALSDDTDSWTTTTAGNIIFGSNPTNDESTSPRGSIDDLVEIFQTQSQRFRPLPRQRPTQQPDTPEDAKTIQDIDLSNL